MKLTRACILIGERMNNDEIKALIEQTSLEKISLRCDL